MGSKEQSTENRIHRPLLLIAVVLTAVFLLCLAGRHSYMKYFNDGLIHGAVFIDGISVSSMSPDDAAALVESARLATYENEGITLKSTLGSLVIGTSDLGYTFNYGEAAAEAYSLGRTADVAKNVLSALQGEKQPVNIELKLQYDRENLADLINEFVTQTKIAVKQPEYAVEARSLKVVSGHPGETISAEQALALASEAVESGSFGEIEVPVIVTLPLMLDTENIYDEIYIAPVNAGYAVENNTATILPEESGRDIDRQVLDTFLSDIQSINDSTASLPLDEVIPEVSAAELGSLLFRDQIGDFFTDFEIDTENGKNRAVNIQLSSQAINGLVLAPGEIFSYNKVVGPRTAAKGYKNAVVYSGGEIVTGIGGGICQVSSTLYNAVLYAGLEVIERSQHNFTVAYVDLGFDAAVSYDLQDIKFRNSTDHPIKIEISFPKKNRIRIVIHGTDVDPNTTYEFKSVIISTKAFPVIYREDSKLKPGDSYVFQYGKNGYTVDSYRITKVNGVETGRVLLYRNVYQPYAQIINRNTSSESAETNAPVSPETTEPPEPTEPLMPVETPEPTEPLEPIEPPEPTEPLEPIEPVG